MLLKGGISLKLKIGVIGSGDDLGKGLSEKSEEIGREIARLNCILLSGAGSGLPYDASKSAKLAGGLVIGISPAANLEEHLEKYKFPVEFFDALVFTGFGLKGRNVPFVRTCDGIVLISGGIGTLNEFTIAYDEGKVVGILEGSGGISESIKEIVGNTGKKGGKIIYDSEPCSLVTKLVESIKQA